MAAWIFVCALTSLVWISIHHTLSTNGGLATEERELGLAKLRTSRAIRSLQDMNITKDETLEGEPSAVRRRLKHSGSNSGRNKEEKPQSQPLGLDYYLHRIHDIGSDLTLSRSARSYGDNNGDDQEELNSDYSKDKEEEEEDGEEDGNEKEKDDDLDQSKHKEHGGKKYRPQNARGQYKVRFTWHQPSKDSNSGRVYKQHHVKGSMSSDNLSGNVFVSKKYETKERRLISSTQQDTIPYSSERTSMNHLEKPPIKYEVQTKKNNEYDESGFPYDYYSETEVYDDMKDAPNSAGSDTEAKTCEDYSSSISFNMNPLFLLITSVIASVLTLTCGCYFLYWICIDRKLVVESHSRQSLERSTSSTSIDDTEGHLFVGR